MLDIFIAEDDTDDLMLFEEALSYVLPRANIIHACNGNQCLKMLAGTTPPDVIFLDVQMPLKTGLQCLTAIKSQAGLSSTPVIMLSTSKELKEVAACYNAGASLYLSKPTDPASLAVALKGVFHMLGRPKKEQRAKDNFIVEASQFRLL